MGDSTKRRLQIPPSYIPYLEKHRIYELYHEIIRELVIQQPSDHVMFIKQILLNASKSRDVPRVVIIASPRINSKELAAHISKITQQIVITEQDLLNVSNKSSRSGLTTALLIKGLSVLTRTNNAYNVGWILVDVIKSREEAEAILQAGILPTHVLHIIPSFYPNFDMLIYCHVPTEFIEYRRKLFGIRHAFQKIMKEVHVKDRSIGAVVNECVELLNIRKGLAPMKPRVLLLGPRGSGRKTQAAFLCCKLNLVHVNFEYLLCQAWKSDADVGKKMRECKDEVCLHPEIIVQIINKRLLEEDCLTRGYVLTHYPYTVQDFQLWDSLDTPPNRVIFLELETNVCRERIKYRRQDAYTGSRIDISEKKVDDDDDTYVMHPKDNPDLVNAEIAYYCEHYGAIRKYCGATASFVNADQNESIVLDCILAIIGRAAPACPPRTGLSETLESNLFLSEISDENRCCCTPIPQVVKDGYRNLFTN